MLQQLIVVVVDTLAEMGILITDLVNDCKVSSQVTTQVISMLMVHKAYIFKLFSTTVQLHTEI